MTHDQEFEARESFVMQPGQEYLGYAMINTMGEMHFRPKVKEERSGETAETLHRTNGITVCQTKNTFLLHITIYKDELTLTNLTNKLMLAIRILKNYIRPKHA